MNSTYFDEIYHARTAYEHILGLEPYENTHPTLGKLIISAGIRLFGMNPFGWRFTGTLFGVLMLPILYHLFKAAVRLHVPLHGRHGALRLRLHALRADAHRDDRHLRRVLHLADVRRDTRFLQTDLMADGWKKILPPLFFKRPVHGLGVASKWTVAYGAVGLAVLFFGKLVFTYRALGLSSLSARKRDETQAAFWQRALKTCLWCCLFFILIPFSVYFAAFLPLTLLPHNRYDVLGRFSPTRRTCTITTRPCRRRTHLSRLGTSGRSTCGTSGTTATTTPTALAACARSRCSAARFSGGRACRRWCTPLSAP